MSMTDPIADLLARIRNAHIAKHDRLDVPSSKLKLEVCRLLQAGLPKQPIKLSRVLRIEFQHADQRQVSVRLEA